MKAKAGTHLQYWGMEIFFLGLVLASCWAPALAQFLAPPSAPIGYESIDCGPKEIVTDAANSEYSLNGTLGPAAGSYNILPLNGTTTGTVSSWYFPALTEEQRTLRSFLADQPGCYWLPVAPGRFNVRLGWAYYNYDGLELWPSFNVSLQGRVMDTVYLSDYERDPEGGAMWSAEDITPTGGKVGLIHYGEYVYPFQSDVAEICLQSLDGVTRPVLSTIELIPFLGEVLPEINIFVPPPTPWALTLRRRIKLGGDPPTMEEDPLLRRWGGETPRTRVSLPVYSESGITGFEPKYEILVDSDPNSVFDIKSFVANAPAPQFPPSVFRSALEGGNMTDGTKFLGVALPFIPFNPANHFLARLFFRELDPQVTSQGQRQFNITFGAPLKYGDKNTTFQRAHWLPAQFSYLFDVWAGTHGEEVLPPDAATPGPEAGFGLTAPGPQMASFGGVNAKPGVPSNSGKDNGRSAFYIAQAGCLPVPSVQGQVFPLYLFLRSQASTPLPPILSGVELYEIVTQAEDLQVCTDISQQPLADTSTTDFPTTDKTGGGSGGLSAGAIVGIVIGSMAAAGLLAFGGVMVYRRWREERMIQEFHKFRATLD